MKLFPRSAYPYTRLILAISILLSLIPVVVALASGNLIGTNSELRDYLYFAALASGLVVTVLFWWQFILGVRGITKIISPDFFTINNVHKFIGIYSLLALLAHPLILVPIYAAADIDLLSPTVANEFDLLVKFGSAAFGIYGLIWYTSAFLRDKLGYRWWKLIHFASYAILPLAFIHGLNLGFTLRNTFLGNYWWLLTISFCLVAIFKIASQFGLGQELGTVAKNNSVATDAYELTIKGLSAKFLDSHHPGQFVYLRLQSFFSESHPFTVLTVDKKKGELKICFRLEGKFTNRVAYLSEGDKLFIDGFYGIFARSISAIKVKESDGGLGVTKQSEGSRVDSNREVVVLAAGIGITPFFELLKVNVGEGESAYRFQLHYLNRDKARAAYRNELQDLAEKNHNFTYSEYFSRADSASGDDRPDIPQIVDSCSKSSAYLICGPSGFIEDTVKQLKASGVHQHNIEFEQFSY